ncbi:uncharacterized protein LOC107274705 isoform X7 [Cephus cinctus]|uniref:Uncharacterized protein LOC107274705 isoform X7 n=1 Tax=Cephus cinctus TaxID=211228 RepID=A0AAJ7R9N9_CEPCN|nr:uncharacterized protein LOC107274705 isoform X7 [Cephus cinctus]
MAVQLDGGGKEDLKTQFVTREGTYKLMTLSEYSRPNRVGYTNSQGSTSVRVSFVTLPDPADPTGTQGLGDRMCFNFGKELYVYVYRGVKKFENMFQAVDLNKPVDKKLYKGTNPTCHNFNQTTATVESAPLLVGFSTGQIQLIDPIKKELSKLYNEEIKSTIPKQAVTINLSPSGELTITPHQVAFCYMRPVGSTKWTVLKVGDTVPIYPGDLFSLLHKKCSFKIISTDDTMGDSNLETRREADERIDKEPPAKKLCLETSVEDIMLPNNNMKDTSSSIEVDPTIEEANTLHLEGETNRKKLEDDPFFKDIYGASFQEAPQLLSALSDAQSTSPKVSPVLCEITSSTLEDQNTEEVNETTTTAVEDANKKIKWDCGRHFSDQSDQAIVSEVRGTDVESSAEDSRNAMQQNSETTQPARRDKCAYGTSCYRKNAFHKAEFSHPGDSDYDTPDDRAECPYGIKCYRKNPQHKLEFKHTTITRGRAQTPLGTETSDAGSEVEELSFEDSAEESVDESEYNPSCCSESSEET